MQVKCGVCWICVGEWWEKDSTTTQFHHLSQQCMINAINKFIYLLPALSLSFFMNMSMIILFLTHLHTSPSYIHVILHRTHTPQHGLFTVAQPQCGLLRLLHPRHCRFFALLHIQDAWFLLRVGVETLLLLSAARGQTSGGRREQRQENDSLGKIRRVFKGGLAYKNKDPFGWDLRHTLLTSFTSCQAGEVLQKECSGMQWREITVD